MTSFKNLLLIFCLICSLLDAKAQFKATYNGFRNLEGKEYQVLEYKDIPVHKLYVLTGKWINRTQYNPNIYTKDIEDESIYLHAADTLKLPGGLIKMKLYIDYGINFEFKDGKVRFQPIIHSLSTPLNIYFGYEGKKQSPHNINMFKQDGSVRGKNGKLFSEALNKWLNKLVSEYDQFMKTGGGEDDW